jgi:hypothetical protein
MAFEIQEVVIQMQISDGAARPVENSNPESTGTSVDRDSIVRECVRRVLLTLKDSRER